MQDHPLRRALPLVLLAGLCFSTLDATAKWLVRDHPLFIVVWARYFGQTMVVIPLAWQRTGPGFWRTKHLGMQLVRSACLVGATMCFFGALRYVPLAEGTALMFLSPMIAVVLSMPVLGERPTRPRWIAAIVGFLGILLLVRPGAAVFQPAALLLVLASVCNTLYQLLTRKVPNDSPHTTLFYSALVGTAALSLMLPFTDMPEQVTYTDGLFLLFLGLLAGLGHWAFTAALLAAPAALVAPFTYIHMVWATIYGYLIFGQLPDAVSAAGMAVIVGTGVGLALRERRR